MKLYLDLDRGYLVNGPLDLQAVTTLSFKRGDTQTITLQFCQGGTTVDLPDPASTGIFGIKKAGDYDGGYLVSSLAWSKSGAGATAAYTFTPSFNTVELNTFIDNSGHPIASVTCMAEIEWTTSAGEITSSNTFTAVIADDVIKGSEGIPTDANAVSANVVWAGPASGEADGPGEFRALVDADLTATALRPPILCNAAYTAVAGDRIETNTSGGGFAVTLPAPPGLGDQPIAIADATQSWAVHPLMIVRNGNPINGAASDFVCNVIGDRVTCTWIGSIWGWSVK